ncbi:HNH endonuclease [Paenibacillus sp. 2RAB27]|uniref:HNH endonuclease n=1 Tax=Paenibacillus sp. 2RAB27 TaxID=3232991 RepID=UPI003F9C3397
MFPKPTPNEKEKKPYNSLQGRKKGKRELPEWKQNLFSHHESKPSKADRAEFPKSVVKAATERSQGVCQYCKQAECKTTHHVFGRGRGGRGVLSNAYRACGNCHIKIEGNDELKNSIIDEYRILYGEYFWFDEQDWEEFNLKQLSVSRAESAQKERMQRIEPVVEILSSAAGRTLKAGEIRLLDGMNEKDIAIISNLVSDVVDKLASVYKSHGYGHFND